MSSAEQARKTERVRRITAAAGSARDYGATLAEVLAAAEQGWRDAAGLADASAQADALLAELGYGPGGHQAAA